MPHCSSRKRAIFRWKLRNKELQSKLADENAKYWKESWKELQLLRLAAAYSRIARTVASKLERLECSCNFYPEHRREYQRKLSTDHSSGERWYKIVEVHFAEMTGVEQISVTTEHISVVWVFYKNETSYHIKRQPNWCFLSLFYFLSIISAFHWSIR